MSISQIRLPGQAACRRVEMNGRGLMIVTCDNQEYKVRACPGRVRGQKASQGYPSDLTDAHLCSRLPSAALAGLGWGPASAIRYP
jgi:hypothetical protein